MRQGKTKLITLSPAAHPFFRVERLVDTVEYAIGQLLDRKEVEDLCELWTWKVTIQKGRDDND